mgnify:CR=1 FL=1
MKRIAGNAAYALLLMAFSFCSFNSYAQNENSISFPEPYTENAEVEIVLKGASPGNVVLLGVYGDQNLIKDSAHADESGRVVFGNKKRYPDGLYYAVFKNNSQMPFLLDRNQKFFLHADKANIIRTMETNSAENRIYYMSKLYESNLMSKIDSVKNEMTKFSSASNEYGALNNEQLRLIDEKAAVISEYKNKYPGSFFVKFKMAGQNPKVPYPTKPNGDLDTMAQTLQIRNEFWKNFDFNDGRLLHTPVYYNKMTKYLTTLFYQQADSLLEGAKFLLEHAEKGDKEIFNFTVNYLMITYEKPPVMGAEKLFCYTVDNYFTLQKAYWADSVTVVRAKMKSDQMRPSLLGATGQDLNCKNEQGEYVSLYSIKKPIRLIFLYNPDCEHCQKEAPKLKALYDKWKSRGLEVYALNVESNYDHWHSFINKLNLDWINVIDPKFESKYLSKYFYTDTPGVYVLDANNKIVAKQILSDQLENVFERMTSK